MEKTRPDLVLVDLWLDNQATCCRSTASIGTVFGIEVIRELRDLFPNQMLVLLTAGFADAYRAAAIEAGADGALPKWMGPQKVLAIVEADALPNEPCRDAPMSLARNAYEYLTRTYLRNARNVAKTARDLAIPRSTVYRKLREMPPRR